jgi:hypothetical protein
MTTPIDWDGAWRELMAQVREKEQSMATNTHRGAAPPEDYDDFSDIRDDPEYKMALATATELLARTVARLRSPEYQMRRSLAYHALELKALQLREFEER